MLMSAAQKMKRAGLWGEWGGCLPAVASTSLETPGRSLPSRSASTMMLRATRSFTLPPGFTARHHQ